MTTHLLNSADIAPLVRRKVVLALCLLLPCTLELSFSAAAQEVNYISFDPPGSTFTQPYSINREGAITGYYDDAQNKSHGFLRARDGTITTFDPPGSIDTIPQSINRAGVIAGYYADAQYVNHGFLRAPDGTFTTFDPPGAANTDPTGINQAGYITGDYSYANGATAYGFLRAPDGTFITVSCIGTSLA